MKFPPLCWVSSSWIDNNLTIPRHDCTPWVNRLAHIGQTANPLQRLLRFVGRLSSRWLYSRKSFFAVKSSLSLFIKNWLLFQLIGSFNQMICDLRTFSRDSRIAPAARSYPSSWLALLIVSGLSWPPWLAASFPLFLRPSPWRRKIPRSEYNFL